MTVYKSLSELPSAKEGDVIYTGTGFAQIGKGNKQTANESDVNVAISQYEEKQITDQINAAVANRSSVNAGSTKLTASQEQALLNAGYSKGITATGQAVYYPGKIASVGTAGTQPIQDQYGQIKLDNTGKQVVNVDGEEYSFEERYEPKGKIPFSQAETQYWDVYKDSSGNTYVRPEGAQYMLQLNEPLSQFKEKRDTLQANVINALETGAGGVARAVPVIGSLAAVQINPFISPLQKGAELQKVVNQPNDIAKNPEYAGVKIINKEATVSFLAGKTVGGVVDVVTAASVASLGIKATAGAVSLAPKVIASTTGEAALKAKLMSQGLGMGITPLTASEEAIMQSSLAKQAAVESAKLAFSEGASVVLPQVAKTLSSTGGKIIASQVVGQGLYYAAPMLVEGGEVVSGTVAKARGIDVDKYAVDLSSPEGLKVAQNQYSFSSKKKVGGTEFSEEQGKKVETFKAGEVTNPIQSYVYSQLPVAGVFDPTRLEQNASIDRDAWRESLSKSNYKDFNSKSKEEQDKIVEANYLKYTQGRAIGSIPAQLASEVGSEISAGSLLSPILPKTVGKFGNVGAAVTLGAASAFYGGGATLVSGGVLSSEGASSYEVQQKVAYQPVTQEGRQAAALQGAVFAGTYSTIQGALLPLGNDAPGIQKVGSPMWQAVGYGVDLPELPGDMTAKAVNRLSGGILGSQDIVVGPAILTANTTTAIEQERNFGTNKVSVDAKVEELQKSLQPGDKILVSSKVANEVNLKAEDATKIKIDSGIDTKVNENLLFNASFNDESKSENKTDVSTGVNTNVGTNVNVMTPVGAPLLPPFLPAGDLSGTSIKRGVSKFFGETGLAASALMSLNDFRVNNVVMPKKKIFGKKKFVKKEKSKISNFIFGGSPLVNSVLFKSKRGQFSYMYLWVAVGMLLLAWFVVLSPIMQNISDGLYVGMQPVIRETQTTISHVDDANLQASMTGVITQQQNSVGATHQIYGALYTYGALLTTIIIFIGFWLLTKKKIVEQGGSIIG